MLSDISHETAPHDPSQIVQKQRESVCKDTNTSQNFPAAPPQPKIINFVPSQFVPSCSEARFLTHGFPLAQAFRKNPTSNDLSQKCRIGADVFLLLVLQVCRRGKEIRKHTKNKQITLIEIILKQQKQPAAGEFFNGFGALKRQIPLKNRPKSSQNPKKFPPAAG